MSQVRIIGGGLAGSEAAWQAAGRGVHVVLHEMRPVRPTAVHKTDRLAELVCSNSFRGDKLDNAVGLLKEEMRRLGSLVHAGGRPTRVCRRVRRSPSTATRFADAVTRGHPGAPAHHRRPRRSAGAAGRRRRARRSSPPARSRPTRCRRPSRRSSAASTSPSTTPSARSCLPRASIARRCSAPRGGTGAWGRPRRRAPPRRRAVGGRACGLDDGQGDYLNCPMTRDEYEAFYDALVARGIRDGPRLRHGDVLRRVPADRGDGASRPRHAALRAR